MKQKMKRIWLVLCMVACLFSLNACTAASTEQEVDAQVSMMLTVGTPSLLTQITERSDVDLEQDIIAFEKEKAYVYSEGFKSWLSVKEETGALLEVLSTTVAVEDDGYSCSVTAQFEQRRLEFRVLLDEDMEITSMAFNPEYTVGEKMEKAALNTLLGMGTVFAVLIFISLIIGCFKYINIFEKKLKEKTAVQTSAAPAASMPAPAPVVEAVEAEEELTDDFELVAVVAAAIAASENVPVEGLVVRSIKRASGAKWKKA